MEQPSQLESRARTRENDKMQGLKGPHMAVVRTVNPETETASVESHGGIKEMPIKHPYLSSDSWIRVMPGANCSALLQYRSDTSLPEVMNYTNPNQGSLLRQYKEGKNAFRNLYPGEINIGSKGYAEIYFSREPILDQRAGVIQQTLNQTDAESSVRAPLHRRVLHQNRSSRLGDEERFGVVTRPKTANSVNYIKSNGGFAKEYFVRLFSNKGKPAILFEKTEGEVFDDSGSPVTQTQTGINLRVLRRYYTTGNEPYQEEIDEEGNSATTYPTSASQGHNLTIPQGNLIETLGKNRQTFVGGSIQEIVLQNVTKQVALVHNTMVGGAMSVQVGGGFSMVSGGAAGAPPGANPRAPSGSGYSLSMDHEDKKQMMLKTESGHHLVFEDKKDKKAISVFHNSGSVFQITTPGEFLFQTVSGNSITTSPEEITVLSKAGSILSLGKEIQVGDSTGSANILMKKDLAQVTSVKDIILNSQQIQLKAGSIALGDKPQFGIAYGEPLVAYLSQLTVATIFGPSSVPIVQPAVWNANIAQSFVSKFVKARGNLQ